MPEVNQPETDVHSRGDSASPTDVQTAGVSDASSQASSQASSWIVGILLASVAAWAIYNFPPKTWRVPNEYSNIGPLSPQSEQDKLAAVEQEILWNNTMMKFTMAGLAMGLCGFFVFGKNLTRHLPSSLVALVSGALAGLAGGVLGLFVRKYLDMEYPLPVIGTQLPDLACDGMVVGLVSMFLLVPLSVLLCMQPDKQTKQKAYSVPLAGLLTGLVVPPAAALIIPQTTTSRYPPIDLAFTAIWFLLLALFAIVLVVFLGSKTGTKTEGV